MIFEENRFENILASLRVRKGWTQEDAAAHIRDIGKGISRRTYIDLETGKLPPSAKHLKLIAGGFKLNQADTDALYHAAHHGSPKIHNLPFRRNPLFTGREDQLKHLAQLLKENYSVALSGLAGIGKTQLVLEYAHKCYVEKVYSAVFWVNAADEESLQIGYAKLAEKLDLPERDEQEQVKIVDAVKQWLDDHTDWLLIMDNADNLPLARSFFPGVSEDNNRHILLTTRSQMVGAVAGEIIEIDKMEPAEGLLFLLRRTRRYGRLLDKAALDTVASDIRKAASHVVGLLDGHPLALDHAGAYIEDGGSFTEYIDRYHERRSELLSERGSLDEENKGKYSEYPTSVFVTFELCFEKAHKRNPLATDILRFCTFLHPDTIPDELLQHDESFMRDATEFKRGRTALLRYSLIKRNYQQKALSMHRLVQAVLTDAISPDLQNQWRERVVRTLNAAFPEVKFEHWRQCERLLPHALVCTMWTEDKLTPTVQVAELFNKAGVYLHERGQYSEAETLLARAFSLYEQHYSVEHSKTATAQNNLAANKIDQAKYEQAEPLLVQALSIQEKQLGAEHPETIIILSNLANLYKKQGKYEQAETLYHQVTTIGVKHFGAEHPETAISLYSLAILYMDQGKYERAEPLLVQVLSIREKQLGAEHPDTAATLSALAHLSMFQGKYEQAETLYRRTIAIQEKHLGPKHRHLALSLLELATLLHVQGKLEQAEALYQRTISMAEQLVGTANPYVQAFKRALCEFPVNIWRDAEAATQIVNDEPSV